MSRRKHLLHKILHEDVDPPGEGQHIVRAVGSRGGNTFEVVFPDGHRTLCLLPARFHKKVWIKRGTYLIVTSIEDTDAAVTGQISNVLYPDQVKSLKKLDGVWPNEFEDNGDAWHGSGEAATEEILGKLDKLGLGEANECKAAVEEEQEEASSSDDGLPPLTRVQNRKLIEYSDSDSESDG